MRTWTILTLLAVSLHARTAQAQVGTHPLDLALQRLEIQNEVSAKHARLTGVRLEITNRSTQLTQVLERERYRLAATQSTQGWSGIEASSMVSWYGFTLYPGVGLTLDRRHSLRSIVPRNIHMISPIEDPHVWVESEYRLHLGRGGITEVIQRFRYSSQKTIGYAWGAEISSTRRSVRDWTRTFGWYIQFPLGERIRLRLAASQVDSDEFARQLAQAARDTTQSLNRRYGLSRYGRIGRGSQAAGFPWQFTVRFDTFVERIR